MRMPRPCFQSAMQKEDTIDDDEIVLSSNSSYEVVSRYSIHHLRASAGNSLHQNACVLTTTSSDGHTQSPLWVKSGNDEIDFALDTEKGNQGSNDSTRPISFALFACFFLCMSLGSFVLVIGAYHAGLSAHERVEQREDNCFHAPTSSPTEVTHPPTLTTPSPTSIPALLTQQSVSDISFDNATDILPASELCIPEQIQQRLEVSMNVTFLGPSSLSLDRVDIETSLREAYNEVSLGCDDACNRWMYQATVLSMETDNTSETDVVRTVVSVRSYLSEWNCTDPEKFATGVFANSTSNNDTPLEFGTIMFETEEILSAVLDSTEYIFIVHVTVQLESSLDRISYMRTNLGFVKVV